jgi:hypothetical protein
MKLPLLAKLDALDPDTAEARRLLPSLRAMRYHLHVGVEIALPRGVVIIPLVLKWRPAPHPDLDSILAR